MSFGTAARGAGEVSDVSVEVPPLFLPSCAAQGWLPTCPLRCHLFFLDVFVRSVFWSLPAGRRQGIDRTNVVVAGAQLAVRRSPVKSVAHLGSVFRKGFAHTLPPKLPAKPSKP